MLQKLIPMTMVSLLSIASYASPKQLITNNHTAAESNAYIDGTIPSVYPSKPYSVNRVFWASVKLACYGHISNNICYALIKMKTDTAEPVDIGWVSLNLVTGEILPQTISNNGYTVTVNRPGETTITETP